MIELPLDIQRSARKSIAISVVKGRVSVRAPKNISEREINALIIKKQAWIEKQNARNQTLEEEAKLRHYEQGGKVLYLGRTYVLHLTEHPWVSLYLQGAALSICSPALSPADIRRILHKWLLEKATRLFHERTAHFTGLLGVNVNSLKMKRYIRRWGSCSNTGQLSYNWLLIQADKKIIDYVVCHEVSHLQHMNHSKAFWSCVASLCPDYKLRRKWLREHGASLALL